MHSARICSKTNLNFNVKKCVLIKAKPLLILLKYIIYYPRTSAKITGLGMTIIGHALRLLA